LTELKKRVEGGYAINPKKDEKKEREFNSPTSIIKEQNDAHIKGVVTPKAIFPLSRSQNFANLGMEGEREREQGFKNREVKKSRVSSRDAWGGCRLIGTGDLVAFWNILFLKFHHLKQEGESYSPGGYFGLPEKKMT